MQAGPIEGFATAVCGSTDLTTAAGAALIILADRSGGSEWQGEDGLSFLNRPSQLAAGSVVLCAGASQRELIERCVRQLLFAREPLVGSAAQALAAASGAIVALGANGSPI